MGIDVWRLRARAGTAEADSAVVAARAARAVLGARDAEALPADPPGKRAAVRPGDDPDRGERLGHPVLEGKEAGRSAREAAVAPFAVLCLTRAGVRLIVLGDDNRSVRRFAADLLAAATGVWGGRSELIRFDWPQPGIDNTRTAQRRALTAFVERQLAESPDDGLCLVDSDVLNRVSQERLPTGYLVLPSLEELMSSAVLKRSVWESIRQQLDA